MALFYYELLKRGELSQAFRKLDKCMALFYYELLKRGELTC
jgi:hypothetical protein